MLPADHRDRMERVRLTLEGIALGDAFGQRFFFPDAFPQGGPGSRALPSGPWHYTDDTVMSLGVASTLDACGRIDPDALAVEFADRFRADPARGYGAGAARILCEILEGASWREASVRAFDGAGSMGNGAAMRAGPIGAYFADDFEQVTTQARLSAAPTHAHLEGQEGAVAVALATAFAHRRGDAPGAARPDLLAFVSEHLRDSAVKTGIDRARQLARNAEAATVACEVGCGHAVLAQDTVPFALWCAWRYRDDLPEALWRTASCGGDRDTTTAIVGGIVALWTGAGGLPRAWLELREPLPTRFRALDP